MVSTRIKCQQGQREHVSISDMEEKNNSCAEWCWHNSVSSTVYSVLSAVLFFSICLLLFTPLHSLHTYSSYIMEISNYLKSFIYLRVWGLSVCWETVQIISYFVMYSITMYIFCPLNVKKKSLHLNLCIVFAVLDYHEQNILITQAT